MFKKFYIQADYKKIIRFFIFGLFFQQFAMASDFSSWTVFKEKHVTPFVDKGTDRTSGFILLSGVLAVGATNNQDERIRSEWKGYQKMDRESAHIGDILGTGAFSLLTAGLQYNYDDREFVYQSQLRGLVYGGISIYTLKTIFARPRPGNSNNHQSFPSGHTTIMFMSATQLQQAYGWGAGSAAYALSIFTGASRLTDDVHWFSDTIAGAFLGIWVGRASFYNQKETVSAVGVSRISFIPILARDNLGLFFDYRF
jgi:hypothetical protein